MCKFAEFINRDLVDFDKWYAFWYFFESHCENMEYL